MATLEFSYEELGQLEILVRCEDRPGAVPQFSFGFNAAAQEHMCKHDPRHKDTCFKCVVMSTLRLTLENGHDAYGKYLRIASKAASADSGSTSTENADNVHAQSQPITAHRPPASEDSPNCHNVAQDNIHLSVLSPAFYHSSENELPALPFELLTQESHSNYIPSPHQPESRTSFHDLPFMTFDTLFPCPPIFNETTDKDFDQHCEYVKRPFDFDQPSPSILSSGSSYEKSSPGSSSSASVSTPCYTKRSPTGSASSTLVSASSSGKPSPTGYSSSSTSVSAKHPPGKRAKLRHHCPSCKSTFGRRHDCLRHEVNAHGKRPEWSCVNCSRYFSKQSALLKHVCPVEGSQPQDLFRVSLFEDMQMARGNA